MAFPEKILIIGCGSVSQCSIPLVLKFIDTPPNKITIIDFVDNRPHIKDAMDKGITYVQDKITPANYAGFLYKYAGPNSLIIDLAWNIDSITMLQWCRDNNALYVNTSIEEWDPYRKASNGSKMADMTLYMLHMKIRELLKKWGENNGSTAIVDHGANPGLVSHFTKAGLIDIAKKIISEKPHDRRINKLKTALHKRDFAVLSQVTGVKTIHISERDMQIINRPKEVDEFVNTWSIEGFFEESIAPSEIGWGTHEKWVPKGAYFHRTGPRNQIYLDKMGIKTFVRSWVPYHEIKGMVIRHGEAFTISEHLTVYEKNKVIYRPSVYYAYCPSDAAIVSLHELEMRRFNLQNRQRIMKNEIIKGDDRLGVLLMGHDLNSWWTGSLLSIEETRRLLPNQNATTLQVAISVVAAAKWMIKNPRRGFLLPDNLPHDEILNFSKPYLGKFISEPVDWTPLKHHDKTFRTFSRTRPKKKDVWQFSTFLI